LPKNNRKLSKNNNFDKLHPPAGLKSKQIHEMHYCHKGCRKTGETNYNPRHHARLNFVMFSKMPPKTEHAEDGAKQDGAYCYSQISRMGHNVFGPEV